MLKRFCLLMLVLASVGVIWAQDATPTLVPLPVFPTPVAGDFDEASVADIDLMALPILPEVTDTARVIFAQGQAAGRNPQVFAKVGDCMTASVEYFLGPYETDDYDLGEHSDLQAALDYFSPIVSDAANPTDESNTSTSSFGRISIAAETGFNTTSVQDPLWSNPTLCGTEESPLACEYRISQAAYALIMFGTNDVMFFEADFFDDNLRLIVQATIQENMVPILSTFPIRPDFPEKSILFNQIVVKIAQDYDLPLVNLFAAVDVLPDRGIDVAQPTHLSIPTVSAGNLTEDNLQYGYPTRNLLTLQVLDLLMTELSADDN
jgi:hypothetical protein